jgi:hypothetical protein
MVHARHGLGGEYLGHFSLVGAQAIKIAHRPNVCRPPRRVKSAASLREDAARELAGVIAERLRAAPPKAEQLGLKL